MDEHFRAFTFVDRITSLQDGVRIHGAYLIPPGLAAFPASLVAEAVGQLAAWAAMAAHHFQRRPVAGLAARVELLAPARPGQMLGLAAELETADEDAVAYGGTACADGIPLIRLQDCVGPMVPVEEYDDPEALRNRFALLCGPGAPPGRFGGLPAFAFTCHGGEPGRCLRATLQLPASAPFFADHFPRRPVFPGSLLMHLNLELAAALAAQVPSPRAGAAWTLRTVLDMKLRAFVAPGETLGLEAKLHDRAGDSASLTVESRRGSEIVASARLQFVPEERA